MARRRGLLGAIGNAIEDAIANERIKREAHRAVMNDPALKPYNMGFGNSEAFEFGQVGGDEFSPALRAEMFRQAGAIDPFLQAGLTPTSLPNDMFATGGRQHQNLQKRARQQLEIAARFADAINGTNHFFYKDKS